MICQLCARDVNQLTKHHLIPKQKINRRKWRRSYRKFEKPPWERKIDVCIPCGKQIHALFTNKELKKEYNTLEALKSSPKIQKWINWVIKKNPQNIKYHGKGD